VSLLTCVAQHGEGTGELLLARSRKKMRACPCIRIPKRSEGSGLVVAHCSRRKAKGTAGVETVERELRCHVDATCTGASSSSSSSSVLYGARREGYRALLVLLRRARRTRHGGWIKRALLTVVGCPRRSRCSQAELN
jgi:hypothetical protein